MSITEVIGATRKFMREDAGHEKVTISSVVAIEPDSKWKVIAEIPGIALERKEVIVDDRDGNVVSLQAGLRTDKSVIRRNRSGCRASASQEVSTPATPWLRGRLR